MDAKKIAFAMRYFFEPGSAGIFIVIIIMIHIGTSFFRSSISSRNCSSLTPVTRCTSGRATNGNTVNPTRLMTK